MSRMTNKNHKNVWFQTDTHWDLSAEGYAKKLQEFQELFLKETDERGVERPVLFSSCITFCASYREEFEINVLAPTDHEPSLKARLVKTRAELLQKLKELETLEFTSDASINVAMLVDRNSYKAMVELIDQLLS